MSTFVPKRPIFLKGVSSYLPERVVDNDALIAWMGSEIRGSWIERRTGIKSRRWADSSQACSDLGIEAARKVFASLPKKTREGIRQIVLGTVSGDYISPPTSPLLQERLGLTECGAFDLGAACAGFVTGLHVVSALVAGTEVDHLLVNAEIRSKYLSKEDFNTAVLFGDGASAVLLSADSPDAQFRVLGTKLASDGAFFDLIKIHAGGSRQPFGAETAPADACLKMGDGASIFLKAVHAMTELPGTLLATLGLRFEDLRWIVPHQANLLLLKEIEKRIPESAGKLVETVSYTGNTSGASVGIALAKLAENPELRKGDRILLASAGGGGLAACAVLERV